MATGTVKFFQDAKGYGFITMDGTNKDIFVHFTGIKPNGVGRRTLENNAKVSFDIVDGEKGKLAQNVTVI